MTDLEMAAECGRLIAQNDDLRWRLADAERQLAEAEETVIQLREMLERQVA